MSDSSHLEFSNASGSRPTAGRPEGRCLHCACGRLVRRGHEYRAVGRDSLRRRRHGLRNGALLSKRGRLSLSSRSRGVLDHSGSWRRFRDGPAQSSGYW